MMMLFGVLDLKGPDFLRFYLLYGAVILAAAYALKWFLARSLPDRPAARWFAGWSPAPEDAYAIALLRGGREAALHTLLGRLVADGHLTVSDRTLLRSAPDYPGDGVESPPGDPAPPLAPIEAAALAAVPSGTAAATALAAVQTAVAPHLRAMEDDLQRNGALATPEEKRPFAFLLAATLAAVPGLGLLKLLVGLSRGKSNVGFLILLAIVFTVAAIPLKPPRRTRAGDRFLAWLRESFEGLKDQAGSPGHSGEAALAAGIFGLAAVPLLVDLQRAFQPPPTSSGDGGSSCSSSDSGGSSCGGDGGGGGCGGCGGGD